MADPVTLALGGAAVGAMMKPKNPLQGAMLGAAAGFTGGAALGAGAGAAAGTVSAGTGIGAGGAALPGVMGAVPTALPSVAAMPLGSGFTAMAPNIAASSLATGSTAAPGLMGSIGAPTFMQQVGSAGEMMAKNPRQTIQGLQSVQGLMEPEQMPQMQQGQIRRSQPLPPVDFASLLNVQPYNPKPISLLG